MNFTIKQSDFPANISVPVGTILPFVGSINDLPPNWQLCDGRLIKDKLSPFNNKNLPVLTDNRFLMGVSPATAVGVTGGNNFIPDDGLHNHGGKTNGLNGYQNGEINYDSGPGHPSPYQMNLNIDSAGNHNHGGENRPLYCGVYFIIRIL